MPALKKYTADSPQSGVYIVANVGGLHPITLQVTPLGRRILERLDYAPGDDVPTQFVWSMYDVGILYTENTLDQNPELPGDPAEVFEQLNVPGKLTREERAELIEWLTEYSGPNASEVDSLRATLEAERAADSGPADATDSRSSDGHATATEASSPAKRTTGRFLDIEVLASGVRPIPDRSEESYVECFVLVVEVSNHADADWDFYPDTEVTVITESGTALGKPLSVVPRRNLNQYSTGRRTISPSASAQFALIYPTEDGPIEVSRLEYSAKPLHRHAGVAPRDPGSSDPEHINVDIDPDSLSTLPGDLDFERTRLDVQTETSNERATAVDIDLVGYEWSERLGIMFVFLEVENSTPGPLTPALSDFTVVSEAGYAYNELGDGSYEGLPDAWATLMIRIPTGARGRVLLPFGSDHAFTPKRLSLERRSSTVEVEFTDETIAASQGAPDSVAISDIRISFR